MTAEIDKMLETLMNLEYKSKSCFDGKHMTLPVISKGQKDAVRTALSEGYFEQLKEAELKIANLEAKVTVYEAIIKNSNFSPVLDSAKMKIADHIESTRTKVEVVRCKDCKHRHLDGMTWNCPFGLSGGEDFFCAYGAKDGDSDDET